jgi:hypothetical protein
LHEEHPKALLNGLDEVEEAVQTLIEAEDLIASLSMLRS